MMDKFTKADLNDGMVAETRNKRRYIKLGERLLNFDGWIPLGNYADNLCHEYLYKGFDIVKVFKVNTNMVIGLEMVLCDEYLEPVWKRDEVKRMTGEEMRQKLEEMTGDKIEIEPSISEMVGTCYKHCDKNRCSECVLDNIGNCNFSNIKIELLKQYYEKVMEDEKQSS